MNHTEQGGSSHMNEEDSVKENKQHGKGGDHHKTITMATIAKAAAVSQGAISSLLNDRDYGIRVSEKTRDRIFKACRELGYIPNDLRAVVRMYPEVGDFCLLVSKDMGNLFQHPFWSRLAGAAMEAVPDGSNPITIASYDEKYDYSDDHQSLPHPIRAGISSKYICIGTPNLTLFQSIIRRGVPLVYIGNEISLPGLTNVVPNYAEASRIAIEYLFKQGHRRIVILSGPFGSTDPQIIELNRGIRMGYDSIGMPIEAQNIIYGDLTFKNGAQSVDMLLERTPKPTAIFCLSDTVAAGVISRALGRGLSVPGDLSVIGCSDDSLSRVMHPALTTVRIPAEEMGIASVKEINERVRSINLLESKKVLLPVQLVERESCAEPKP